MALQRLVWLLVLALAGCAARGVPEPIWVGHLAPLSGPDRSVGQQARQGIQLAIDEMVAEDKKIAGRSLAVVHVDSRNDDETVRAQTVVLLTVNKVSALIGSLDAALAERLVREAQPFGPAATVVVSGEIAGDIRWDAAFSLGVAAEWRGQLLARHLQEWKLGRVAVLTDSQSTIGGNVAAAFVRQARKLKSADLREWTFDSSADKTDWQTDVAAWKPAAVLLAASARVFRRESQRLLQAGCKVPFLYGGEDVGPDAVTADAGEAQVYLASVFCREGLSAKGKEMADRFAKANGDPPGYAALQAYDAICLIYEGLKQGQTAGSRLRDRLAALTGFESVTGPLAFKEGRALRPVFLLQIKGRESKLLETVAPDAP